MTYQQRSRLRPGDVLTLGSAGLRSKPSRAALSALGIAIGIAAMISVVGLSTSGQARLEQEFERLGTGLLTVSAGEDLAGKPVQLAKDAPEAIARIPEVDRVSAIGVLSDTHVYRSQFIDPSNTGGLTAAAARMNLLGTVSGELSSGVWLNDATQRFPTTVLGATAAERLGVSGPGVRVLIGDVPHTVVGILEPVALVPELDSVALIGEANARESFGFDGAPTSIFETSADEHVERVRALLPATVSPEKPGEISVSRPSDALAAKHATAQALTGMLVGLGGISLLVGGIGVANTMIITVLERRKEIGLRRALGAKRSHILVQFLTEALLLSALGGIAGSVAGLLVTAVLARLNGWLLSIPPMLFVLSMSATLLVGAIAGLYPSIRAARLPPTAALSA